MSIKTKIISGIVSLVMVATILSIALVAHAEDKRQDEYRRMLAENEEHYEVAIRRFLADEGFKNAGINLTKTFDEKDEMTYKLVINHHSFEYASEDKLEEFAVLFSDPDEFYLDSDVRVEFSY